MEAIVELYLLGSIQIKYQGKKLCGFESRKAVALLCYLAAQKRPVSRTQLTHLFWGNKDEQRGRSNLSRVLHNNAALLPDCFVISRETIELKTTPEIFVDIHCFMELAKQPALSSLQEAVTYYRDDFMTDIGVKGCPEFDTWLITEQELWRQRLTTTLHTLIIQYRNDGNYEQGVHFVEHLLAQEPWHEEAHRELMLMLALTGKRTAALAQYEKCCTVLSDELGVNPSAETTALYYRIRNGEVRNKPNLPTIHAIPHRFQESQPTLPLLPATGQIGEGNGHHRFLLDYALPEEAYAPSERRIATDFGQILERLTNPVCRLLTIVGPNNAVQQHLLAEVMSSLTKVFYDGIYVVKSSNRGHASFFVDLVDSLQLPHDSALLDEGEQVNSWLFKQLREKKLLLVFNNVEQYLGNLFLLEEILKRAPLLKVLISAQAPLQLISEWIFDIY